MGATVMHIREDLDLLQEHLSRLYPMTESEKMVSMEPPVVQSCVNVRELSLDDACAVLRSACKRRPTRNDPSVAPTLSPKMGDPLMGASSSIRAASDNKK